MNGRNSTNLLQPNYLTGMASETPRDLNNPYPGEVWRLRLDSESFDQIRNKTLRLTWLIIARKLLVT